MYYYAGARDCRWWWIFPVERSLLDGAFSRAHAEPWCSGRPARTARTARTADSAKARPGHSSHPHFFLLPISGRRDPCSRLLCGTGSGLQGRAGCMHAPLPLAAGVGRGRRLSSFTGLVGPRRLSQKTGGKGLPSLHQTTSVPWVVARISRDSRLILSLSRSSLCLDHRRTQTSPHTTLLFRASIPLQRIAPALLSPLHSWCHSAL